MKAKELQKILSQCSGEEEVVIKIVGESIGPMPSVQLDAVGFGFDWDSGKIILWPNKSLKVVKEKL